MTKKTKDSRMKILINPPPSDRRCECCGRHIHDLKPFGGAGDPLVGDFKGQLLVKNFRAMAGRNAEAEKILKKVQDKMEKENEMNYEHFEEYLVEEVGEEEAQQLMLYDQITNTVEASWECRDCIVLDGDDFYKKRAEGRYKE